MCFAVSTTGHVNQGTTSALGLKNHPHPNVLRTPVGAHPNTLNHHRWAPTSASATTSIVEDPRWIRARRCPSYLLNQSRTQRCSNDDEFHGLVSHQDLRSDRLATDRFPTTAQHDVWQTGGSADRSLCVDRLGRRRIRYVVDNWSHPSYVSVEIICKYLFTLYSSNIKENTNAGSGMERMFRSAD